jgi:putative redox protein
MSTTFKTTIEHVTHTTSRAVVRTHTMLVDRGVAKGGNDLGPAGGEYMLVSLGGCFTSHLLGAIRARDAAMTNVKVAVTGTLDGSPEHFTGFTVDVTAECGDAELARKMITIAERACQVMNTLRPSTPIAISYQGVLMESAASAEAVA